MKLQYIKYVLYRAVDQFEVEESNWLDDLTLFFSVHHFLISVLTEKTGVLHVI